MKKTILAASLLGAFASMAHAQSSVTMYGVVDEFVDVANNGSTNVKRLQSGGIFGSRLGFKGTEDLGGGLKAIFTLETGINADEGTLGQGGLAFGRQSWVGVSGNYGTLTAGRQYPAYFIALATYGLGGGMGWGNASNYFTDPIPLRVNNSLSYVSPVMSGFTVRGLYGLGESTVVGQKSVGNIGSASVQYENGPFSTTLAYEGRKTTALNSERFVAFGASYDFKVVKTAVLLQTRRDDISARENNGYEISATIPFATASLLLDVGRFKNKLDGNGGAKSYSVRYDYFLSKRTTLYTGVAKISNDANATFGINGATSAALAAVAGTDPHAVIFGVRHTF